MGEACAVLARGHADMLGEEAREGVQALVAQFAGDVRDLLIAVDQ